MNIWEAPAYEHLQDKVKDSKGKEVLVLKGNFYPIGRAGCFGGLGRDVTISAKLGILSDDKVICEREDHEFVLPTDGYVGLRSFYIEGWEFEEGSIKLQFTDFSLYSGPLERHASLHVLVGDEVEKYFKINNIMGKQLILENVGNENISENLDRYVAAFSKKEDDKFYREALDLLDVNSQREFTF